MGIQSTQRITREDAITRISLIHGLLQSKKYRDIEDVTSEHDYDLKSYVDSYKSFLVIANIEDYTDTMLEDIIDEPYFRYSMFDNYIIE